MAKLVRQLKEDNYRSYTEHWELNNNLEMSVSFNKLHADVFIYSSTGDVADQIFNLLKEDHQFSSMELIALASFYIKIDLEVLKPFMQAVEAIDASRLKEGKKY